MAKKAKKAVRSAKSKPKKKVSKAAARSGGRRSSKQIAPVEKPTTPQVDPYERPEIPSQAAAPATSTATGSVADPGQPETYSSGPGEGLPNAPVAVPSPEKQWIDNVTQQNPIVSEPLQKVGTDA